MRERERDRVRVGEGQRELETQNLMQAPGLWAVSTEPDIGLEPMTARSGPALSWALNWPLIYFFWERERVCVCVHEQGWEAEGERENLKQVPYLEWSLTWGPFPASQHGQSLVACQSTQGTDFHLHNLLYKAWGSKADVFSPPPPFVVEVDTQECAYVLVSSLLAFISLL